MRAPRLRFTARWMMGGIVLLALVLTIIFQDALLRRNASREQELRAALTRAEAKVEWVEAINEWHGIDSNPSARKRWAASMNYDEWVRTSAQPAGR